MCALFSLTGIQEILHKTSSSQDQPTRFEFDWKTTTPTTAESSELDNVAATPPPAQPSIKSKPPPLTIPNSATTSAADTDHRSLQSLPDHVNDIDIDAPPAPVSASYAVPGSSGTLKETHIFTPNKIHASPPIARTASADAESAACPDFDYEKAAAGIIINENVVKKEYRDVEYNPDLTISATAPAAADDFSDFQSSTPTATTNPLDSRGFSSVLLQPTKCIVTVEPNSIVIDWPKPGEIAADDIIPAVMPTNALMPSFTDSFDAFLTADPIPMSQPHVDNVRQLEITAASTAAAKPIMPKPISPLSAYARPVIGVSPSDAMFGSSGANKLSGRTANSDTIVDDDFSDFQCVAPVSSGTRTTVVPQTRPIAVNSILMPQTLLPQQTVSAGRTSLNWPEPGIDPDELARLEAIFPTPKTTHTTNLAAAAAAKPIPPVTSAPAPADDDEWSDFVAANPTSQPITHVLSQNITKLQTAKTKTPTDDDDWSDFVSSSTSGGVGPITAASQWNSAPKFTSWNAPPQFSDWQSASIYKPPPQFYSAPTNNAADCATAKANNGYNYNGNHFNRPNSASGYSVQSFKSTPSAAAPTGNLYRPTAAKTPSISLIPDLGFIAPTKSFSISSAGSNSSVGGPTANASSNSASNRSRMIHFAGKK